ncbi:MAG: ATP-binding protein [Acaryochloridaceae cyanobacterium RL_2_7]|nr:ATP-binding protein [Acaryochloridaceae cyanobacterium RL_2_7]
MCLSWPQSLTDFFTSKQYPAIYCLNNQIFHDTPLVKGDYSQVRRIFENLISNAVKYNPEGVELTLTAVRLEIGEPFVRCSVIDNGIGIDPMKSEELFKIYSRGTTSSPSQAGYGLGLYICRKIIEVHGGEIGVETLLKEGQSFGLHCQSRSLLNQCHNQTRGRAKLPSLFDCERC